MKTNTIDYCVTQLASTGNESYQIAVIFLSLIIVFALFLICLLFIKSKKYDKTTTRLKTEAIKSAQNKAKLIIEEAKVEKDIILKKIKIDQEILELKEKEVDNILRDNRFLKDSLLKNENKVSEHKRQLNAKLHDVIEILEKNSNYTEEEAKNKLIEFIKIKYDNFLTEQLAIRNSHLNMVNKEKNRAILLNMLANVSTSVVYEGTSNVFKLSCPDEKAKIIGKDGRNLKAIQRILGVDIVLKYSEDEILITSFDPIRRYVASRVIKNLLDKKRLQPQSIEDEAKKIEGELKFEFYQKGLETANENKIYDFSENILTHLGMLEYRSSYGQSVLKHSIEVGQISRLIAIELELDPILAFKCGILHDIGKAVDKSQEGTHVSLGVKLLKAENMDEIIINSVEAHHEDVEKKSLYAEIVSIADTISASRPGARNLDLEQFITRMNDIENMIKEFEGVKEVYALKSGRQIRVMVNPQIISDFDMSELAVKIKEKISLINTTPGEVVISIIREKRFSIPL
ncbi:HD domain-containing protein [Spiroplasma endosymbiont of Aspidapion aeneum]|uniref:HD domain-containing protein n=1 Tax=Spiroplasma endosymbiont of Aspidapion aeneum TaxID=3066276 RepID=UPI00313C47EF